jgi:tetratricopeptide (TPR) repeat protein
MLGIGIAAFIVQAVLQNGLGSQPLPKDFENVTVNGKTYKKLKPGVPNPAFWGLASHYATDFSAGKSGVTTGLSPDQLLFVLGGFRELIAGILWVKADSFFDTGNYDAILPLIRLVTILDPHQIDVYATGMWHIGYNFTDEEQRSDRRYIPAALALGKEGYTNNPTTYEMFFETGWMWYHKIDDDYENAVRLFVEAQKREDMLPARKNLLAMAYQRDGKPDMALDTYFRLYDDAAKRFKDDQSFGARQNRDTIENNIDTTLVRLVQRGWVADHGEVGNTAAGGGKDVNKAAYDNEPPFDVGFSAKVTVTDQRVLKVEGTWGVQPVGTRIRIVLRDEDYPGGRPAAMDWDASSKVNLEPDKTLTFMQDGLFVKNRRFNRKIDMSRDPTMYPFAKPKYVVEFYYNPRSAPPHIQDKFSWDGSGMTDKNFLNTEVRKGQRVIYAKLELTRDQLLRRGEWADRVPVVKTSNYIEPKNQYEDNSETVIDIPSLRSGK